MSNLREYIYIGNSCDSDSTSIGAIVPCYRDGLGKWREYLLDKHLPSYKYISNIPNIRFSYNLQNFYDKEEINEIIDNISESISLNPTWSAVIQIRDKYNSNPVSMMRVRYDAASAIDDSDIFLFLDDDVIFHDKSGDKYSQIIKYMNKFESCGAIMSAGFLGGYTYGDKIKVAYSKHMWTNRGLFIRNISDELGYLLFPPKYIDYPGGFEDLVPVIELSKHGYYLGTSFNNNAFHKSRGMDTKQKDSSKKADRYSNSEDICNATLSFGMLKSYLWNELGIFYDGNDVGTFRKFLKIVYKNYYLIKSKEGIDVYSNPSNYEIDPNIL